MAKLSTRIHNMAREKRIIDITNLSPEQKKNFYNYAILMDIIQNFRGPIPTDIYSDILLEAVLTGKRDIVEATLLYFNMGINLQDIDGSTMFHLLVDNKEAINLLVELGADPLVTNRQGQSGLEFIRRYNPDSEILLKRSGKYLKQLRSESKQETEEAKEQIAKDREARSDLYERGITEIKAELKEIKEKEEQEKDKIWQEQQLIKEQEADLNALVLIQQEEREKEAARIKLERKREKAELNKQNQLAKKLLNEQKKGQVQKVVSIPKEEKKLPVITPIDESPLIQKKFKEKTPEQKKKREEKLAQREMDDAVWEIIKNTKAIEVDDLVLENCLDTIEPINIFLPSNVWRECGDKNSETNQKEDEQDGNSKTCNSPDEGRLHKTEQNSGSSENTRSHKEDHTESQDQKKRKTSPIEGENEVSEFPGNYLKDYLDMINGFPDIIKLYFLNTNFLENLLELYQRYKEFFDIKARCLKFTEIFAKAEVEKDDEYSNDYGKAKVNIDQIDVFEENMQGMPIGEVMHMVGLNKYFIL